MRGILRLKRIYLLALIPISLIFTFIAKQSSYFAEQIFALKIYKVCSQILSLITGILSFSLAEVLLIAIPFGIIILFIWFITNLIRDKVNRKDRLIKGILNLFCTGSVLLFMFTLFGGLNYYRYSFAHYSNLEITESSISELYSLTEQLALQANELRTCIPSTDDNGVFKLSMSINELSKEANTVFHSLSEDYSVLGGYYGAPKPILLSPLMSYTEITGIFIPFTMEANVNTDPPDYTIPATMFHEMAHQRGFMREDEANYIAYLAGMKSDNVEFQYSSTMLALITAGNALYDQDPDKYFQIRDQYAEGILLDLRATSLYWQQFEDTTVSVMSNKINDSYLKANAQADGVKSYGRMLDLLLAKYRSEKQGID